MDTNRQDACPGCDGTITRAIQQGREIATYERCAGCEEREARVWDKFGDAIIVPRQPFRPAT